VGLERGPLSLVRTIEELLERKSSGFDLESREHGRRDSSRWPRGTLYPQKLALTSPTSCGRSVGIVRSLIQAMELFVYLRFSCYMNIKTAVFWEKMVYSLADGYQRFDCIYCLHHQGISDEVV
jgi:hypothetical protein